jgi:hypothetical protein
MKNLRIYMIYTFYTAIALTAVAEASISDVVVNQRWPWSEKVDVDFILSGETNDVEVTATWDGHPAPYRLGTLFGCAPGQRRFTWDPAKSEFAGQTLTGFTVALSNVAASAHTYLIVDLVNGGYEYLAEAPAGGWTDEYKSSKMVFRRIPAGTYTLGEPVETFTHLQHYGPGTVTTTNCNPRTVTFTSDFYVGVFMYTRAQHRSLGFEASGDADSKPQDNLSYNALRGAKPDIDWPTTGYRVANGSIVAKLREKAGDGLVVDLCEEEQWEVAARANTTTFWPTGGTSDETFGQHTNQVSAIAAWYGNTTSTAQKAVGTVKRDNGWGLYDVVGLAGEWTLDCAKNTGTSTPVLGLPSSSVDPVGADGWMYRIIKSASGNASNTEFWWLLPSRRQLAEPSTGTCSTRFCIHLKPLGNLSFEGL